MKANKKVLKEDVKQLKEYTYGGIHDILINYIKDYDRNIKLLDVGCGPGVLIVRLKKIGFKNLHGCDGFLCPEIPNFKKANIDNPLPYKDSTFDMVLLSEVIEHVENPNYVINDIHRILKKGGVLIINTPNIHTLVGKLNFLLRGEFIGFSESDSKFSFCTGHIVPFSLRNTMRIFVDKFTIKKEFYGDFMIPFVHTHIPIRTKLFGNTLFAVLKKK
jgi:ubiquinone/menaquinone biosynthesis C-methylase UbiE